MCFFLHSDGSLQGRTRLTVRSPPPTVVGCWSDSFDPVVIVAVNDFKWMWIVEHEWWKIMQLIYN